MTDMFNQARKVRSVNVCVCRAIPTQFLAAVQIIDIAAAPTSIHACTHTDNNHNDRSPLAKKTLGSTFTGTLRILLCAACPAPPPRPPPKGQKPARKPPDAACVRACVCVGMGAAK